ncbi:hypothetical protein [Pseudomonas abieticivorans]|uniref:hypothetical protein n=1 Tax=Pseudomonas abieticivorans TaxID=2931382 RepID=UPI0020BF55E7|nr:hypothetical protein [Pseudomonas sp. PIA16]
MRNIDNLAAPVVLEAINETLNPIHVPASGASVNIAAYPTQQIGDEVKLVWDGPTYFEESLTITEATAGKVISFKVPDAVKDTTPDSVITVYYSVIRGRDVFPSIILTLYVVASHRPVIAK